MEKPFKCPVTNCSFSFANEDHLTVHKKKHELCLTLTPTSANYKAIFIDQTPTPSRILGPTVDLGLHDLQNENPFDITFRKANSSNTSSNIVIPESSSLIASLPDSEVLNTPSIILPSEPSTPISLKPNFLKKCTVKDFESEISNGNTDSLPFTPNEQVVQNVVAAEENAENADLPSETANFSSITTSNYSVIPANVENASKRDESKNVLQTSVITSVGNTTILKANAIGVPTAVVVTRPPVNSIPTITTSQVSVVTQQNNNVKLQESTQAVLQPFNVAPVVQLMIRLPDGQTVQLPVVANTTTTAQPAQTVASVAPQVTSRTSDTKMKLKEVLALNKKSLSTARKSFSISKVKSKSSASVVHDNVDIDASPPLAPMRTSHNGRKRRDLIDDPGEKRKRSLERNRAAAIRCREKRKVWINALEQKAEELAHTNTQLQNEVTQLRNEVANLKTMLLAHKDCPVTMQQKQSGFEAQRETYTTVRIITSAPDDFHRVPSSSPLNSDFMEMEVNSVQSNSDASLTSDASDVSCRER